VTIPTLLINTHPGENPEFIDPLAAFIRKNKGQLAVISGYEKLDPRRYQNHNIILSGVPLTAPYSLATKDTQQRISDHFGWIKKWPGPILGICYGHQVLAHLFGGRIQSLREPVVRPQYPISINKERSDRGIFTGIETLEVFAEHRDYVATVPDSFRVLSRKHAIPYIMHARQRNIYGIQFVPEQSGPRTKEALIRFLELNPSAAE